MAPGVPESGPVTEEHEDPRRPQTEEQRQQQQLTNRSNRSDIATEGNVLEVHVDEQGLTLVIANLDGRVVIELRCAATCPTVRVGDYVEVEGEKIHEQLYEATDVFVNRPGR
jgi:hypothetical protein